MIEISDGRKSHIQGVVAELLLKCYLSEQGYTVVKAMYVLPGRTYVKKKEISRALKKMSPEKLEELFKIMEDNKKGFPDFLCEKDGIISFVEVKTSSAPSKIQDQAHQILKDLGFKVQIAFVEVDFDFKDISFSDV